MDFISLLKRGLSYIVDIPIKTVQSRYSGPLHIVWSQGRKVLNTSQVNYSFQSLHRVFKWSFRQVGLPNNMKRILILGIGGGSIVELIRKTHHSQAVIDAVDIDEAILELATTEFNIHQYDPVTLHHIDAAQFILNTGNKYDLICLDVFIQDEVPPHLLNQDIIEKLIQHLSPQGKLFINTMMNSTLNIKNLQTLLDRLANTSLGSTMQFRILEPEQNNRVVVISK